MFLLMTLLLLEDASLTSLQTEAFCLQNRYKTSRGRERVSATHTAASDQQDHPKRERSIQSLASLLSAAAWEPISALCQRSSRRSEVWALVTSMKLTVHLALFSTGCYWQLLVRMHGMSLLVSTIWVIHAIAISSYSSSHHSLSSPYFILPGKLTCSLALLRSKFFVPFLFQLALFLSSSAAFPVEFQQSSKGFLGFKQLTADHNPLSSSLNSVHTHF